MAKEKFETFRGLLRGAICNRTQAQFANESGISPEHLSRMLNAETIHRPTRSTLLKIASAAKNGITYHVLDDALNREDPSYKPKTLDDMRQDAKLKEARKDFKPTFEERADETFRLLSDQLTTVTLPQICPSITDFLEETLRVFQETFPEALHISYETTLSREYYGSTKKEKRPCRYLCADLSVADLEHAAESYLLVYYMPIGEQVVIRDASMAVTDIMDLYGLPPFLTEHEILTDTDPEDDLEEAMNKPYCFHVSETKRFREPYRTKDPFTTLFGKPYKYPDTIPGFGFWLETVPERFTDFVKNHLDAVMACYEKNPDKYESVRAGFEAILYSDDGPEEKTDALMKYLDEQEYEDASNWEEGWQAVISNVMTEESGFSFTFQKHPEQDDFAPLSDKDCILIEDETIIDNRISRETLLNLTCKYAKELGLKQFGDILFHTVITDYRKNFTYNVKYDRTETETEMEEDVPEHYEFRPLTPDDHPGSVGLYAVRLRDDRILRCLYIPEHNAWVAYHREWSDMIADYDPNPIRVPPQDTTDGTGPESETASD